MNQSCHNSHLHTMYINNSHHMILKFHDFEPNNLQLDMSIRGEFQYLETPADGANKYSALSYWSPLIFMPGPLKNYTNYFIWFCRMYHVWLIILWYKCYTGYAHEWCSSKSNSVHWGSKWRRNFSSVYKWWNSVIEKNIYSRHIVDKIRQLAQSCPLMRVLFFLYFFKW